MMKCVGSQRGLVLLVTLLVSCILLLVVFELAYSLATAWHAARGSVRSFQAELAADAGLLWARALLEEDAARSGIDHLGETWASSIGAAELNGWRIQVFLYDSLHGEDAEDGTERTRSLRGLSERYRLDALEVLFEKEKHNVNTVPRRVLQRAFPELTTASIDDILARRAERPFERISQLRTIRDVTDVTFAKLAKGLDVRSNLFLLLLTCERRGRNVDRFAGVLRRTGREVRVEYFCSLEARQ